MTFAADATDARFGPWNPGIESRVPEPLRHLCTIFRPENVFTTAAQAGELRDLTGMGFSELVAFRPQRLALHELLVRVTADFSVPDGSRIEDLGINFRQITRVILTRYIEPRINAITSTYDEARRQLSTIIESELDALFSAAAAARTSTLRQSRAGLFGFFERRRASIVVAESGVSWERRQIAHWETKAHSAGDGLQKAAYRALARVISALLLRHGRVWGGRELIASRVTDIACNHFGSEEIGRLIKDRESNGTARHRKQRSRC